MTLLTDIADTADELTNPQQHIERIQITDAHRNKRLRRLWIVTLPSLLDQLAGAVIPGEAYTEDDSTGRSEFESKPAARLDAIDRILAIEAGAALWCHRSGLAPRNDPAANIRAMVGAAPTIGSDNQHAMLSDLRAWRTWAATVTGWERPPDAPRAPCPACDTRNTLRIRIAHSTACCLHCGAAWDASNAGLLAAHIDSYAIRTRDTKDLRSAAVAHRRAQESARAALAGRTRPDLPYDEDLHNVRI